MTKARIHKGEPVAPTVEPVAPVATRPTTASAVDANGRVIVVRRASPSARLRMYGLVKDNDLARNDMYMGHIGLAMSIVSIDGVAELAPQSISEVAKLLDILGDEGFEAAAAALATLAPPVGDIAGHAKN